MLPPESHCALSDAAPWQGLAVASVQWGPWAGAGMAALSTALAKRLARLGLRLISPWSGLNALGACLHTV